MTGLPLKALLLSRILLIGLSPPVNACRICVLPDDGFATMHPRSIDVAVATGAARQEGLLTALELRGDIEDQLERWQLIQRFAGNLAASRQNMESESLHLICVDSGAKAWFTLEGDRAFEIPPVSRSGDLEPDLTALTSEMAIRAVRDGRLSLVIASEKGLLFAERGSDERVIFGSAPKLQSSSDTARMTHGWWLPGLVAAAALALSIGLAVQR